MQCRRARNYAVRSLKTIPVREDPRRELRVYALRNWKFDHADVFDYTDQKYRCVAQHPRYARTHVRTRVQRSEVQRVRSMLAIISALGRRRFSRASVELPSAVTWQHCD